MIADCSDPVSDASAGVDSAVVEAAERRSDRDVDNIARP
jgi:hypothetical protein